MITWEDKPEGNKYDHCLISQIPKHLAEEITRLGVEIKKLGERYKLLLTSDIWKTKGFALYLAKELANTDLGQTVITKATEEATELAFESGSSIMNWDIGGITVKEYLATATDWTTAAVNITQLLCSFPLFLVGIVKYALDNLSNLMDDELELVESINKDVNELKGLIGTPLDESVNAELRNKISVAKGLLEEIVIPLARASVEIEEGKGITKSYMETVRSNIYAAKGVLTQTYDQAKNDERIQKNASVWEAIQTSGDDTIEDIWGSLSFEALNSAIEWKEKERTIWINYGKLAKKQGEVRATLSGIRGTAEMILAADSFFDAKLGKVDKAMRATNQWVRGFYKKRVEETANMVNRMVAQMTAYLDDTSDIFDVALQYPQWVGQLTYMTLSVYNEGFDLASGWTAQTDEISGDYAKLAGLMNTVDLLEDEDPSLLFFRQLLAFNNGFSRAAQGKGSIDTIAEYINVIRDLYVSWIENVKRMTTVEFEHYEALGDFVETLSRWGIDVSNFKTGNISEVYSYGYLVGTGIDVVINCLVKKKAILDEDPDSEESEKSRIKTLLDKCRDIKEKKSKDLSDQVGAIQDEIDLTVKQQNKIKAILQDFMKMARYTLAAAQGDTEGAENWALLTGMFNYDEE